MASGDLWDQGLPQGVSSSFRGSQVVSGDHEWPCGVTDDRGDSQMAWGLNMSSWSHGWL
jgi:hypothetical protein